MKNLKSLIEEALYKASHCDDPIVRKKANVLAEDAYQMKKVNEFYARSLAEDALYLIKKCGKMNVFDRILTGTFPFSLIDSAARPLVEWNITGKTAQDGTPTPANPIEVKGVGKSTENLVDKTKVRVGWYSTATTQIIPDTIDGSFVVVKVKPNTTYTFSKKYFNISAERNTVILSTAYPGNTRITYNTILNRSYATETWSFTTGSNDNYASIMFARSGTEQEIANIAETMMLIEGSDPIPYVPYGYWLEFNSAAAGHTSATSKIFLSSPLMEGDTLDNAGTRTINMVEKVLTGTEGWLTSGNNIFYLENPDGKQSAISLNYAYCSHYENSQVPNAGMPAQSMKHSPVGSGGVPNIWFKDTSIASTAAFKAYLAEQYAAGTPVIVWYPLETPRIEEISVSPIPTVVGNSTLDIDSEVRPTSAMITYKSTTPEE